MKHVIVIAGPTASGKTKLACDLSDYFGVPVISADSRQVYKELSIGTAKPSDEILKKYPHLFVNHRSIFDKPYNAGMFELEGLAALEKIFSESDVALVCGGTGLYIYALCEGLESGLPDPDETFRSSWMEVYQTSGIAPLVEEIKKLDPVFWDLHPTKSPNRLIRYLEIMHLTGKKLSDIYHKNAPGRPFQTHYFYLNPPREELYQRINERVDQMIEQGLENEARNLYPFKKLKPLNTVGYKEWWDYFEGNKTLKEIIEQIKTNTRRYAKRQFTWFKNKGNYQPLYPYTFKEVLKIIDRAIKTKQ